MSPFELSSPDNSIVEKEERRTVETRRKSVSFDRQSVTAAEVLDSGAEIQKSLSQLESKLGKLESMILTLMDNFPLPKSSPTLEVEVSKQNSNV